MKVYNPKEVYFSRMIERPMRVFVDEISMLFNKTAQEVIRGPVEILHDEEKNTWMIRENPDGFRLESRGRISCRSVMRDILKSQDRYGHVKSAAFLLVPGSCNEPKGIYHLIPE